MTTTSIHQSSMGSRIADLVVLTLSFFGFAMLLGIELNNQVVTDLFFYVAVVFISLRVTRRIVFGYVGYSKRILKILIGNVSGLVTGALTVMITSHFFNAIETRMVLIILSSLLAFFILGTLSPLINVSSNDRLVHN